MANKTHEIEWKLRVGATGGEQVAALQKDLESLGKIDSFEKLETKTAAAQEAWAAATKKVESLAAAIKKAKDPIASMKLEMDQANTAAASLKKQFDDQVVALSAAKKATQETHTAWKEAKASVSGLSLEIKKIGDPTEKMVAEFLAAQKKVKDLSTKLSEQRQALNASKAATKMAGDAWKEAQAKASALGKEIKSAEGPTRLLATQLDAAKKSSAGLKDQFEKSRSSLNDVRTSLQNSGISTTKLSAAQVELKKRIADASDTGVAKVRGLGTTIGNAEQTVSRFAASWQQMAASAAGLAVFGLAAKEAVQMEAALVDLRRAANLSKEEAKDLGEQFRDMASDLGMSAVQITKLATAAAKTGIAKADLAEFARIAATAAMNFDMLPEDAGEALAKLKNVLGVGISDMEAFVATLNELADNAATSEAAIVDALKLGGSSAIQFGLTAKQAAALATSFLSLGATSEQAGTSMRTLLGRLRSATMSSGEAGRALQGIVGDTRSFAKVMAVDASGALMTFLGALNRMPSAQRFKALQEIFQDGLDTENISKLASGVDLLGSAMGRAAKSDEELVESLRELTSMKLDSTESELNKLGAAWRSAGAAVGELFLPVIRAASVALVAVADAIRNVVSIAPGISTLAAVGAAVTLAWTPIRILFSALAPVVTRLGTVAASAGTALRAVVTAVGAGTGVFVAARAGVAGLGLAIKGLMGPVGWAITGLTLLWDAWRLFGKDEGTKAAIEAQQKAFAQIGEELRGIGDASAAAKNQISQAMTDAKAPIEGLVASYKGVAEQIKSTLSERLTAIDAAAQRELAVVQSNHQGQRDLIQETARLALEAETKKIQAIDGSGQQLLAAWERTYGQALAIERAAGVTGSKLAAEARDAKLAIYQQIEGAYRATVDRLISEEQRNLAAVKEIEQQRMMLKMSVEDKIRALKQKTMTDEQAYADKVKQIEEKIALAREASAKGQTEAAKRYADEAISLAQANANAVTTTVEQAGKATQQTVVTLEEAVKTSSGQILQAYQIIDQDMAKTATTGAHSAQALHTQAESVQNQWAELKKQIDELKNQQAVEIEVAITANMDTARTAIDQLKALGAAESVQIRLDADVAAANASLAAWKNDPANKDLALQARVDQAVLATTMANLRTSLEAANLQAPATLDIVPAQAAFAELQNTLNNTQTTSTHTVDDNVPEAMGNLEALNAHDTGSQHTVDSNTGQVQSAINALKHNTSSTHTIYVRRVETRATGGPVPGFHAGGRLPGYSLRDNMMGMIRGRWPIALAGGEQITNALSTRVLGRYAPGLLEGLNRVRTQADISRVLAGIKGLHGLASGGRVAEQYRFTFASGGRESTVTTSSRAEADGLKALAAAMQRQKLLAGV